MSESCPPEHAHHGIAEAKSQAIFGGADGLTTAIGLIVSLGALHPHVIFAASVGAALSGFAGMTGGAKLSGSSVCAAVANGGATVLACVLPALPWVFWHGLPAVTVSAMIALGLGIIIAWARPEHGWRAIVQTFGVLLVAGMLCYIATLFGV